MAEPLDGKGASKQEPVEFTFGECEGLCGRMVERVGGDRYCFACQDEMREEQAEQWAAMDDEDERLYGI